MERVDDEYGLDVPQLFIVNVSLPEEVEQAMDARTSMGVIGDMNRFQQFQMGNAMEAAAENPAGGGAAEGMGLGMGFAMANRMVQAPGMVAGAPMAPSPIVVESIRTTPANSPIVPVQKHSSAELAVPLEVLPAGQTLHSEPPRPSAYFPFGQDGTREGEETRHEMQRWLVRATGTPPL